MSYAKLTMTQKLRRAEVMLAEIRRDLQTLNPDDSGAALGIAITQVAVAQVEVARAAARLTDWSAAYQKARDARNRERIANAVAEMRANPKLREFLADLKASGTTNMVD